MHHVCRLERRWIEVTADTQVDALLDAVKYGLKCEAQGSNVVPKRSLVFTNTVDAANSVFDILQRVGVPCILYHRETPMEERAKNLQYFRERGGVLVCTDAASRGLDIPNIDHVIQVCIDFAIQNLCCYSIEFSFFAMLSVFLFLETMQLKFDPIGLTIHEVILRRSVLSCLLYHCLRLTPPCLNI